MQPQHQRREVEPLPRRHEHLAVEHEPFLAEREQRVDHLREIARERPVVAGAQVDLVAGAARGTAEAVPLRLVQPAAVRGQLPRQPAQHRPQPLGHAWRSVSTSPNRSPCSSTRASTSSIPKTSESASPRSTASETSSHVTGVETVGRAFARTEYAHTIDLCSVFWLQSMNTLPRRASLAIRETTSSGQRRSSISATPRAIGLVSAYATLVFSGT